MCLGYFERYRVERRMPKKADPLGIRYEGPVLTGKMSLELAQELEKAVQRTKEGEEFARPEEYDAVLRAHCRLDKKG